MTPFYAAFTRELHADMADNDLANDFVLKQMFDCHCFEVSAILDVASDLHFRQLDNPLPEERLFLPAPKTWIEWKTSEHWFGLLLLEQNLCNADYTIVKLCTTSLDRLWPPYFECTGLTPEHVRGAFCPGFEKARRQKLLDRIAPHPIAALLALINTPQIVGRRQHMPSRKLEREVMKRRGSGVQFPLRAWTEIRLEITPPRDAMLDEPHEAHLTGAKARHFVRKHLRIQHGKLVTVKAHWRGDAALGIKQSRYTVTASGAL